MSRYQNIAVIGAGITGVTTAYSLLNRGFDVTVFDRNRYSAMETSFANGGQLSASNAEVWTQWGTIFKGIKWMFEPGAPLLVNPKPSWHKYSWMAEFMSNIPSYEANTVQTVKLAIEARKHLLSFANQEGFDFHCEKKGILHIYQDRKELAHARKVNKLLAKGGLNRQEISSSEAKKIEPTISGELCGAFYTESDFTGDIHRYTANLSDACKKRGVVFEYNSDVTKVSYDDPCGGVNVSWEKGHVDPQEQVKHFDAIVVCAGVHSRQIAMQLGDRVNIYPVKGYSITVNLNDDASQRSAPWVSLLDDKAKIVTSRLGLDRFRIAGTAEFNGFNKDIRNDRIDPLIKWCETYFPGVSTEHVIPWTGLRPMMPNMMPKVGAGKKSGVFYNTGHGHLGWTLSAATSESIAELIFESSKPQAA